MACSYGDSTRALLVLACLRLLFVTAAMSIISCCSKPPVRSRHQHVHFLQAGCHSYTPKQDFQITVWQTFDTFIMLQILFKMAADWHDLIDYNAHPLPTLNDNWMQTKQSATLVPPDIDYTSRCIQLACSHSRLAT